MPEDETSQSVAQAWTWDPTLYAGSAAFYPVGRVGYPVGLADLLVQHLALDGTGALLDVGCGPGSLTLLLAPYFARVIGVDADADMLVEAARLAGRQEIGNVSWRQLRAEQLPADLPAFDMVTFAQSFHWMERPLVAATVRSMLVADGVVVHVGAMTHQGFEGTDELPLPRPPWADIAQLVQRYLGSERRAGQGVLPNGTPGGEDDIFWAAGFRGPERLHVPGWIVERTVDEIAAAVYSLSSSAPHLFGDNLARFDSELRHLLESASEDGRFSESMGSITLSLWRR